MQRQIGPACENDASNARILRRTAISEDADCLCMSAVFVDGSYDPFSGLSKFLIAPADVAAFQSILVSV